MSSKVIKIDTPQPGKGQLSKLNKYQIETLQPLTLALLNDAIGEICAQRKNLPKTLEPRFGSAEYLLRKAEDFINGAWSELAADRPQASLALSRWMLEAAFNLNWVVSDTDKIDARLKDLCAEALRLEALRLEDMAHLYPEKAHKMKVRAEHARQPMTGLGSNRLPSIEERADSLKQIGKTDGLKVYGLYRECSTAVHPSLNIWHQFDQANNFKESCTPTGNSALACWMIPAATLYLVAAAYCLTDLGDKDALDRWWTKKIAPLLPE